MAYKWCIVSHCKNTSIKFPDKVFISVPRNPHTRKLWAELAGRSYDSFKPSSNVFMCEDHFDMEKDTKNYRQYKMKLCQKILLTENAVPSKLCCEVNLRRHSSDTSETNVKRQKIVDIQQSEENFQTQNETVKEIMKVKSLEMQKITLDKETNTEVVRTKEKSVQACRKAILHDRSKSIQTKNDSTSISTSPFQVSTTPRFTSPLKLTDSSLPIYSVSSLTSTLSSKEDTDSTGTVKTAKAEWKKLRDNHRDSLKRLKEKCSGKEIDIKNQWRYAENMEFLVPYMKTRDKSNVSLNFNDSDNDDPFLSPLSLVYEPNILAVKEENKTSEDEEPPLKRKKDIEIVNVNSLYEDRMVEMAPNQHPLDSFFVSMCETTKQFPPFMQRKIKRQIFALISDAEDALDKDNRVGDSGYVIEDRIETSQEDKINKRLAELKNWPDVNHPE